MNQQVISELALLDRVQMTAADRAAAKATAARAEAIAEAVYRATLAVQAAAQWIFTNILSALPAGSKFQNLLGAAKAELSHRDPP